MQQAGGRRLVVALDVVRAPSFCAARLLLALTHQVVVRRSLGEAFPSRKPNYGSVLIVYSSRLFLKVFGAYAALTLVSATAFVLLIFNWQRDIVVWRVEQRLHDSAVLLRSSL